MLRWNLEQWQQTRKFESGTRHSQNHCRLPKLCGCAMRTRIPKFPGTQVKSFSLVAAPQMSPSYFTVRPPSSDQDPAPNPWRHCHSVTPASRRLFCRFAADFTPRFRPVIRYLLPLGMPVPDGDTSAF
jgi:hypothetical protein